MKTNSAEYIIKRDNQLADMMINDNCFNCDPAEFEGVYLAKKINGNGSGNSSYEKIIEAVDLRDLLESEAFKEIMKNKAPILLGERFINSEIKLFNKAIGNI